jgi:isocitrate dehydrogenase
MYWAQALAEQDKNLELKEKFGKLSQQLSTNEIAIVAELNESQGKSIDLGGYYHLNSEKAAQSMRPSSLFNSAIESLG